MTKCRKSRIICYAKNAKNHATFAETLWPEMYARGRFMKYSMSDFCELVDLRIFIDLCGFFLRICGFWKYKNQDPKSQSNCMQNAVDLWISFIDSFLGVFM